MVSRFRQRVGRLPGARPISGALRRMFGRGIALGRAGGRALLPSSLTARRMLDALQADPGWLPPEAPELVMRLNAALRTLRDEDASNRWLHHRWTVLFEEVFDAVGDELTPRPGFDAVSFGAGSRNPLALPFLFF